ncbi:unnamed protein product [Candida verbasci]|uniref:Methyltransferase small domain-containing protein n=1 Tax=Candida verbasci TaxID=1227364 RepID=A0A9W4TZM0_9ASCO|nr:unnamed protein product [Candida verbasci]
MLPTPIINDIDYDRVYEPSEDSFLLLDCFEQEQGTLQSKLKGKLPIITEIGTGSGIVTTFILQNILQNGVYMTTDINPHACNQVLQTLKANGQNNKVDSLQMDLTGAIRSNLIDILIFNPPYVPAEEVPDIPDSNDDPTWLDVALLGGEDGMKITWKVLRNLDKILSSDGIAYILFCARNKPESIQEYMQSSGWKVDIILTRKAGWEVLSILKFYR